MRNRRLLYAVALLLLTGVIAPAPAFAYVGPGLGAGSGTLVAKQLLRPPASQRALTKVRAAWGQTPFRGV